MFEQQGALVIPLTRTTRHPINLTVETLIMARGKRDTNPTINCVCVFSIYNLCNSHARQFVYLIRVVMYTCKIVVMKTKHGLVIM